MLHVPLPSNPTFGCLKEQSVTYAAVFVSLGLRDKFHRLGGFNNRQLFLTVLEARKFKIKFPVNVVSGEVPLSGLQRAIFLLCLHVGDDRQRNAEGTGTCPFLICVSPAAGPVWRPLTMFTSETMSMLATSIRIPTSTGGPAGEVGYVMNIFLEWRQAGLGRGASLHLLHSKWAPSTPTPCLQGITWENMWAHA